MAVIKPVEVADSGLEVTYWKITHRQDDYNAQVIDVTLHGYKDQAARDAGKSPLGSLRFRFGAEAFAGDTPLHNLTTAAIYAVIATTAEVDGGGSNPLLYGEPA